MSSDFSWALVNPSPVASTITLTLCLIAAFSSVTISSISPDSQDTHQQSTLLKRLGRLTFYLALGSVFLTRLGIHFGNFGVLHEHPIDTLIFDAKNIHLQWAKQAAASRTLGEAVDNYKRRYRRAPPPRFDIWYEFATNRSSAVIDDFDSIYEDLLPFWAVSPDVLRRQTWELISNPENDAGGIMIRNGQMQISPKVPGTHRWMLDAVAAVIDKFVQFLPDMDLALNINDESRVSVPFEVIEPLRQAALASLNPDKEVSPEFTPDRGSQWRDVPAIDSPVIHFQDVSFEHIFHRWGIAGCEPRSKARVERHWEINELCASCASPHSNGQFVSDWNLAASPCHQPDLADLHGLYLAPSRLRGSHNLVPVFSQSKPGGFNDIIYPSAWNYVDKIMYAPNEENPDFAWHDKQPDFFWRGATSEGFANGSQTWRGMSRQRFVHLTNNDTNLQPVLVSYGDKYAYENMRSNELRSQLSTSTAFVGDVVRCAGDDCWRQATEFGMVGGVDFQSHWRYKYLLDLDGAGFSGRFLPFLQSNSVVMKAALFREWWSPRIQAWRHFVPLDLRGHGVWSTLAYFQGLDATVKGKHIRIPPHEQEGQMIADEGRYWASKALRKEDMEIFFFRLLLEWGRITDDAREEIGFSI